MLKGKQVVAVMLLAVAAHMALRDSDAQADPGPTISSDRKQAQQAVEPEHPQPSLLRLRDCAQRDAALTMQQKQLDAEQAALRAEKARLAARERALQALRSNSSTESLMQEERELNRASAQLQKKIDNFDHLSAPYRVGVLYQWQHCAFSQVRRQDLLQLCQEGTYPLFCAKYQAFQTDE